MKRALLLIPSGLGLAALVAGLGSFAGCSSSGSSGSSSSGGGGFSNTPPTGPDVPLPAGVTLQPNVVTVHGGASVIKGLSPDHGIWTIDKSADGASGIAAGKVLLIAGVDCANVTAVTDNGDGTLAVTVAPAKFTDVVQEGSYTFDTSHLDLSQGVLGQVPYSIVVASEQTDAGATTGDGGTAEGGAGDGGEGGDAGCQTGDADGGTGCAVRHPQDLHLEGMGATNSVSLTIGKWTVGFNGSITGGALDIGVTGTYSPTSNVGSILGDPAATLGGITTQVSLKAHVNDIQGAVGALNISGGSISSANMSAPITGSADMSAQMSTMMGSQYPAEAVLKIPVSTEFPVYWGPIPLYLSFSAAFLIQPSLATQNAVLNLSTHIDFAGNAGLSFSAGAASASSMPMATTPADPITTNSNSPQIGAMAVVFALQAPRIGLGVGTMAFGIGAKAGIYVDAINALGLVVGPATALVPCESADWDFSSHGGGEMSIKLGPVNVSGSHTIVLATAMDPGTWYAPLVNICKP
jgi:hypothetical protein